MANSNEEKTKGVDERLAARDKQVAETYERMDKARPTPTQRENDLAKVGVVVEQKEPDGGEPQDDHTRRILESKLPGENPYDTRMEGARRRRPE